MVLIIAMSFAVVSIRIYAINYYSDGYCIDIQLLHFRHSKDKMAKKVI